MIIINTSKNRGFTLIELLVVIAIIGVLASTVLGSLQGARVTARDTKRVSEAREFAKALEIYRNRTGTYPCYGDSPLVGLCPSTVSILNATDGSADTALLTVLSYTPTGDTAYSGNGTIQYRVISTSDRTGYSIRVRKEVDGAWCHSSSMGAGIPAWVAYPSC